MGGVINFDHHHYVPVLKGKQGELEALRRAQSTDKFTPLVEVPPIPLAYPPGQDDPIVAKSIDEYVAHVSDKFVKALRGLTSVFVDAYFIESEDELENGRSPIEAIFESLREGEVNFIPTLGLDRVEDYIDSIKDTVQMDDRGCCLRLVEADLEGIADLGDQIGALLNTLGVTAAEVDLLVDFGPRVPSKAALPFQIDALPLLNDWRTLTVTSSSFPPDMSGVARNSIEEIEREEWRAWVWLRSKQRSLRRMPTFGDYAINHPVFIELDPRFISMSPNIRYTDTLNYVIAKGQAQPRKKRAGTPEQLAARAKLARNEQYPKLAAMIKSHESWKGPNFSWGDAFIDKCSRRECVGNPTDWRAVGTSHHIASVVQQIANLP